MHNKILSPYKIADILQRISVLTQSDSAAKDYGTGQKYTPIEVHTISFIAEHPGCTSVQIAYAWGKSSSAVCQVIKKLKKYGLITVSYDSSNKKNQLLYLTESGRTLDEKHRSFDDEKLTSVLNIIQEKYSVEQINTAFDILEAYVNFYCEAKSHTK